MTTLAEIRLNKEAIVCAETWPLPDIPDEVRVEYRKIHEQFRTLITLFGPDDLVLATARRLIDMGGVMFYKRVDDAPRSDVHDEYEDHTGDDTDGADDSESGD